MLRRHHDHPEWSAAAFGALLDPDATASERWKRKLPLYRQAEIFTARARGAKTYVEPWRRAFRRAGI